MTRVTPCPVHSRVFTTHPSGKCSACRAADAPAVQPVADYCLLCDGPCMWDRQHEVAAETYAARRKRIAAERNPGVHYDTCTGCGKFTACENGLLTMCDDCYAAWPGVDTDPPATTGIQRAVDALTRRQPGVGYGSHGFQP